MTAYFSRPGYSKKLNATTGGDREGEIPSHVHLAAPGPDKGLPINLVDGEPWCLQNKHRARSELQPSTRKFKGLEHSSTPWRRGGPKPSSNPTLGTVEFLYHLATT